MLLLLLLLRVVRLKVRVDGRQQVVDDGRGVNCGASGDRSGLQ